jgi:hypothetical protein
MTLLAKGLGGNPGPEESARSSPGVGPPYPSIRDAAIAALTAGLCVVPPKQDGSKAPFGEWGEFIARRSNLDDLRGWYGTKGTPKMTGVGTVCGKVAGNLEAFEFDAGGESYGPFKEAARGLGMGDLVDRLEAGYAERSPSSGVHWLYRCETEVCGNTKLASRYKEPDEFTESDRQAVASAKEKGKDHRPVTTLIETRGEGGYIITAPTNGKVHPTGGAYEMIGGSFKTIPTITAKERESLWRLARSFNQVVKDEARPEPAGPRLAGGNQKQWDDILSPAEDFNAQADWDQTLKGAGWSKVCASGENEYWRRPGKDSSWSATLHRAKGTFYVFTSSTELEPGRGYSLFGVAAATGFGGDFGKAAKALIDQGYGQHKRWVQEGGNWTLKTFPNPCPPGERRAWPEDKPPTEDAKTSANGKHDQAQIFDLSTLSDEDLGILRATAVKPTNVRWLWKYRLAIGELALLAGDGGIGKSMLIQYILAIITRGWDWPCGEGRATPGNVIIVSAEDDPATSITPRLMAMGADLDRVTFLKAKMVIRREGRPPVVDFMSLSREHHAYWRETFRRLDPKVMVVDPLPSYLGRGVNDSKNTEIRAVIEPFLEEIVRPSGICLIGNTHLNKSTNARTPLQRISGSVAYGNIPRNTHLVSRDPEAHGRRIFQQAKCNDAPDDLPAIAYTVERTTVDFEGETIETARPLFEAEGTTFDMTAALTGGGQPGGRHGPRGPAPAKTTAVAEWLYDLLSDGMKHPLGWIFDQAGAAGHIGSRRPDGKWSSGALMYQAKDRLSDLAEPREGKRVDDIKAPFGGGNRPVVHWYLADADAAF